MPTALQPRRESACSTPSGEQVPLRVDDIACSVSVVASVVDHLVGTFLSRSARRSQTARGKFRCLYPYSARQPNSRDDPRSESRTSTGSQARQAWPHLHRRADAWDSQEEDSMAKDRRSARVSSRCSGPKAPVADRKPDIRRRPFDYRDDDPPFAKQGRTPVSLARISLYAAPYGDRPSVTLRCGNAGDRHAPTVRDAAMVGKRITLVLVGETDAHTSISAEPSRTHPRLAADMLSSGPCYRRRALAAPFLALGGRVGVSIARRVSGQGAEEGSRCSPNCRRLANHTRRMLATQHQRTYLPFADTSGTLLRPLYFSARRFSREWHARAKRFAVSVVSPEDACRPLHLRPYYARPPHRSRGSRRGASARAVSLHDWR